MNRNKTVLSYRETLLRESDVDLLRGPYWLNDTVISFYLEYLEHERFKTHPSILFVPPDVTQCIKVMPSHEIGVFLEPLLQIYREFVFFALNDNQITETSGGSHWSLLVFSRRERMVFHYDSSRGSNEQQAVDFGEKLLRYFSLPYHGKFMEAPCLQQNNGYDCGVHLLCNTEQLAGFISHYGRVQGCPKISEGVVQLKRGEILGIIDKLKNRRR